MPNACKQGEGREGKGREGFGILNADTRGGGLFFGCYWGVISVRHYLKYPANPRKY